MVRTPHFHCRGHGFNSLVRELRSCKPWGKNKSLKKKKKKKKKTQFNGIIQCVPLLKFSDAFSVLFYLRGGGAWRCKELFYGNLC